MFEHEPVRSLVSAVHSRNMQLMFLTFMCVSLTRIVDSLKTNNTFFYFAYGSNLLAKRIHINNPSAVFYSVARLSRYRLDFNMISDTWNGAVATIVEDDDDEVLGIVWALNKADQHLLDEQEGLSLDWYFAKNVTVTTPTGRKIVARTYEEIEDTPKLEKGAIRPLDRTPSSTYLEVIFLGAIEAGLPAAYVAHLISFPTNGKLASLEIRDQLGYPFN
ncbi:gamma-glutamylcyclotransferase-like [Trichoplusia ni]|uniref:gamma-glutamylcyclotransferase n=1 Tax=Trichoplusia ni TaxID=7111 RepID=A0A7E5WFL2_TRINI|nr:gamma-glutamylcyclotransferase-like [Trichoplusia ni]